MEFYFHDLDKDVMIVAVDGGLNGDTAEQFLTDMQKIADLGIRKIIVDCTGLTYISSSGISALLSLHKKMKAHGANVKVAGARSFVLDVLRVAHLDKLFEMYPDVSRARLEFRPPASETEADAAGDVSFDAKSQIRVALRRLLLTISVEERAQQSETIVRSILELPEYRQSKLVVCFWPLPELAEVDLRPLITHALASGKQVALPRVDWSDQSMSPRLFTSPETDLEPDPSSPKFKLLQPKSTCPEAPLDAIDLVLVPGLAFDRTGRRLGRGKGLYDRFLAKLAGKGDGPRRVGVAFDIQILAALPTDPHDQPVHALVSSGGVIRFDQPAPRPA